MSNRRLLVLVVTLALTLFTTTDAAAARETVDLLTLDVPKGWTKEEKPRSYTSWTAVDQRKGTYCRVAVMLSTPSKGTIASDFEHEWNELIAKQYGASTAPSVTGPRSQGGWEIKNGTAPISFNGVPATATLSTMTGGGKTLSIVILTNSESYAPAIRKILESVELQKLATATAPVAAATPATAASGSPAVVTASGKIPTGETPDLFPGSTGWLPSGRGVPIPAPKIVGGSPQGLWWTLQLRGVGNAVAVPILFLPDGTRASNPRYGSGTLVDIDGQRKQKGSTGVGTFSVSNGSITQSYDGFTNTNPITYGTSAEGPWMNIGAARYSPLEPITSNALVGAWKGAGARYVFRADGTYESGHVLDSGEFTLGVGGRGTWVLEGHLLAIRPAEGPGWITPVGRTGKELLVLGTKTYSRE